jgi:hypothetical protein
MLTTFRSTQGLRPNHFHDLNNKTGKTSGNPKLGPVSAGGKRVGPVIERATGSKPELDSDHINLGICIAPIPALPAALGAESRVCYPGNTAGKLNEERSRTTTSRSQQQIRTKVNSLPPLGFELVIIGMLAHLSNHSTKSHPKAPITINWFIGVGIKELAAPNMLRCLWASSNSQNSKRENYPKK